MVFSIWISSFDQFKFAVKMAFFLMRTLRRGAPWRGRLARDLQQVFVKGKGGPAAALHSTGMYYKVIRFSH
jgi:hypothetical protein